MSYSASSTIISSSQTPKFQSERSFSSNPSPSTTNRHWKKLRTTVIATHLFKTPDVSVMQDLNELLEDVESSPYPHVAPDPTELYSAIEAHRAQESLFQLVARGSAEDLAEIETILKSDPKRFIRSSNDPNSLVNKKSPQGQTLVYQAAVHGHPSVVQLLIQSGGNAHEPSTVGKGETETPLEAACRWGHHGVVDVLLREEKWSAKELKCALKLAKFSEIRVRVEFVQRKVRSKKRCLFCF